MPNTPVLGLPYPEGTDTADVPRDIRALAEAIEAQSALPVGALCLWPSDTPPAGWAICNGQTVDAALNPKLAAIFGSAGGLVTLPDLRDRVPIGASAAKAVRSSGGANARTLSVNHLPQHHHQHVASSGAAYWFGTSTPFINPGSGGTTPVIAPQTGSNATGGVSNQAGVLQTVGQAFDTTPAHVAVHFIVKLG